MIGWELAWSNGVCQGEVSEQIIAVDDLWAIAD